MPAIATVLHLGFVPTIGAEAVTLMPVQQRTCVGQGGEVVGRKPRSDVQSVEFDKGALKGALKISFTDGGWWEFEIPKIYRKTTEQVIQALTPAG